MFGRLLLSNYILIKKSSLLLGSLLAAGLVCYHFYTCHRPELRRDLEQMTDDAVDTARDVAKKGARKAKEVMDDVKA